MWRTTIIEVLSNCASHENKRATYTCSYRASRTSDAPCDAHAGIITIRRSIRTRRNITTIRCNVTTSDPTGFEAEFDEACMANKELNLKSHIVEELHPLKVPELRTASAGMTG